MQCTLFVYNNILYRAICWNSRVY